MSSNPSSLASANPFTPLTDPIHLSPVYSPTPFAYEFKTQAGTDQGPRAPPARSSMELDEKHSGLTDTPVVGAPIVLRSQPGNGPRDPNARAQTSAVPPTVRPPTHTVRVIPTVSNPAIGVVDNIGAVSTPSPPQAQPVSVPSSPASSVSSSASSGRGTNRRPPDPNSRRSGQRRVAAAPPRGPAAHSADLSLTNISVNNTLRDIDHSLTHLVPTLDPVRAATFTATLRQAQAALLPAVRGSISDPVEDIRQALENSMIDQMPTTTPEPALPPGYAASVNNGRMPLITPANRVARGGPVRDLPCLLNPTQLEYLSTHYPGVTFMATRHENIPHSHPLLALERKWCEEYVVSQAAPLGVVVDIGGNASRHHNSRDNVWSCCPLLTSEDAPRNYRYRGIPNWCEHKFQDCVCVVPDAYIAVHSLYYLGPELVCRAVNSCKSKVLWSAHHMFDRAYGSLAMGEAQYTVNQKEIVTMHSNGNVTDYVHSACAWLYEGYYTAEDGTAMAWTIEKTFPNTVIMRFNAAPANLPVPKNGYRGFVPCLNDLNYFGPMQLQGAFNTNAQSSPSAHFVNETISKMTFSSWGTSVIAMESISPNR